MWKDWVGCVCGSMVREEAKKVCGRWDMWMNESAHMGANILGGHAIWFAYGGWVAKGKERNGSGRSLGLGWYVRGWVDFGCPRAWGGAGWNPALRGA